MREGEIKKNGGLGEEEQARLEVKGRKGNGIDGWERRVGIF